MKLGHDIARTRVAEEGAGEQWFLTPFSPLKSDIELAIIGLGKDQHTILIGKMS